MNDGLLGGAGATLTRRFRESPDVLFHAFTDPERLLQWWCPYGFRTEAIDFPAITGRGYSVALRADDGALWVHEGVFLVVDPPHRLSYTWRWTTGPLSRHESLVEIRFEAVVGGTDVTIAHTRFDAPDEASAHERGWLDACERLERLLAP
ncbi:MAG: SRPBCC domain-containing protein [Vicinamibacterales bacterium]